MAITKEKVLDIMRGSNTQKISFSFTGSTGIKIQIRPEHFTRVATAISEDRISIVEGGVSAGMAKYSSRAEGTDAANTLYVPRNSNATSKDFKGLIVHESVHAIFDLYSSRVPWVDNEAAAYVAQGYYLRNAGHPRRLINENGGAYYGLMIIDSIFDGDDEQSQFWLDALRNSLLSDPLYHSYIRSQFIGDG